ncbi:MAG: IS5/IS1182 family transposase, partial [bacterium]
PGTGAVLCFMGHALMENRSGLIVQGDLTKADGQAERRAALDMIHRHSPGSTRQLTLGADKGFDAAEFVADLRQACVTPHVALKSSHSAIDGRTIRHECYDFYIKHRNRM